MLPQEGEKKDSISIYSEHRDGIKPEVTTYLYGCLSLKMTLTSSNCTSACCLLQFFQRRPGERRMLGSVRESVNTLPLHSPAGVFELCSAGTSVVLVLLVASWAPVSSSLSPADSSSEDSLKKKKGVTCGSAGGRGWESLEQRSCPHPNCCWCKHHHYLSVGSSSKEGLILGACNLC